MPNDIRPYGPGKFDTILDAYVYKVSLNGCCDDEIGSEYAGSWHGLMRNGRTIFVDHDPLLESLNEAEQAHLTESAGVILSEDSRGFVEVEYFDTAESLATAWNALLAEHETDDEVDA